jgi:hypothetical protein
LETAFSLYGMTPEDIQKRTYKIYGFASLEDEGKDVLKSFNAMNKKYDLSATMPIERYYRNDEENDLFKTREIVDTYVN